MNDDMGAEIRSNTARDRPELPERVKGIEPSLSAWEADVLPLNYTREPPYCTRSVCAVAPALPPAVSRQTSYAAPPGPCSPGRRRASIATSTVNSYSRQLIPVSARIAPASDATVAWSVTCRARPDRYASSSVSSGGYECSA